MNRTLIASILLTCSYGSYLLPNDEPQKKTNVALAAKTALMLAISGVTATAAAFETYSTIGMLREYQPADGDLSKGSICWESLTKVSALFFTSYSSFKEAVKSWRKARS